MTAGMTRYEKIAISLPVHAAESVRRAVRSGHAPSASAYVAAAIEEKAKNEDLRTLLEEMLQETGGPLTPAEIRAADRALGLSTSRKKGRGSRRTNAKRSAHAKRSRVKRSPKAQRR